MDQGKGTALPLKKPAVDEKESSLAHSQEHSYFAFMLQFEF